MNTIISKQSDSAFGIYIVPQRWYYIKQNEALLTHLFYRTQAD